MLLGTQEHIEVWELLPEGGAERATSGIQKHTTLRERLSYSRHPEGDYCPGATHQADSQSRVAQTHATLASRCNVVVMERDLAGGESQSCGAAGRVLEGESPGGEEEKKGG